MYPGTSNAYSSNMGPSVFYAWQSFKPELNRYFIKNALVAALKELRKDDDLYEPPRLDHDTKDTPGWPDIMRTILAKIETCDVFVADVTIINSDQDRLTPNPNVMFELGYALAKLGDKRIVLVHNASFFPRGATIADMPFDIRGRRGGIRYTLTERDEQEAQIKTQLVGALAAAIRSALVAGPQADLIRFLGETNPQALVMLRQGLRDLRLMVATHRLAELQRLQTGLFQRYVTITSTGSNSGSNMNTIGGHINDCAAGPLAGFRFLFGTEFDPTTCDA
jgi:hypothetical protein